MSMNSQNFGGFGQEQLEMHANILKIAFSFFLSSSQINNYYNGDLDALHQNKITL